MNLLEASEVFFHLREGSTTEILCLPEASGVWKCEAMCSELPAPSWDREGKAKSISEKLAPGTDISEPPNEATL